MTSPYARFAALNTLVRHHRLPLVTRTVVIGGVAMLDWELQQSARFGAETWGPIGRTTEDIDIVIAAADDRGWLDALTASHWTRDAQKRYRWRPPGEAAAQCAVDLLGQYGGSEQAGGSELRLQDYWGGEDGAYICRVLRAYQGQRKFPTILTESFWDPTMQGFQWLRLNHMGLVLSKISAVGTVLERGDSEHQRGLTPASRLAKDLADLARLLRDEVVGHVAGWQGQVILDDLVPSLVDEVLAHLHVITTAAQAGHHDPASAYALAAVNARLPAWKARHAP
jgi:hypothetical protein